MKKIICYIMAAVCILMLGGCKQKKPAPQPSTEVTSTIVRDPKYDSATVALSPEEFEKAGFKLGDSCDISFENGYTIEDVPFYNGYYVKNNEPVVVAYPGFKNISITYNNVGICAVAKLTDGDKVTIRLNKQGKYSDIQDTLGQVYSFNYADYDSSEQFCNFRALTGGNLKEDFLFRGASPVDNSRGRAAYTDKLLKDNGITFVVDLADSEEDMQGYMKDKDFASPYSASLHENNQIALLSMGSGYQSKEYEQKVADGMKAMIQSKGPVYLHCMEGKDRTGFVCFLLEALAGASYEEMRADYMKTYENYYSVSEKQTPEKYNAIAELYFDAFVEFLHGTDNKEELVSADYVQDAKNYLIDGGMSKAEVEQLREFITK
ncbi:MAG: tyrosine-protein phosphatase [Clostridia bacterium]|nr:tyrosine-protein phosphatase [Clostridia bacterium]